MKGPGKYDYLVTMVREATQADAVAVIVLHGIHGSGFSVQAMADISDRLPRLLRILADEIEREPEGHEP